MVKNYFQQPKIYATTPKEKKEYNFRGFLFLCIFVFLFLLAVWFILFSSFFKIKKIIISGSLNQDVQSEIERLRGRNILLFRVAKTQKELAKKQSSISTLEMRKGIPDTLKVKVNVRTPKLIWRVQDKNYFVDESGIVFELGTDYFSDGQDSQLLVIKDEKNAPVVTGNQILSEDFIRFIQKVNNDFYAKTGAKIQEVQIEETTLYPRVVSTEGWKVYLDVSRSPDKQLDVLKKILESYKDQIKEYVDLRVEGKAYYK